MEKDRRPLAWRARHYRMRAQLANHNASGVADAQVRECWERLVIGWSQLADTADRLVDEPE